ncbi:hypothetical protein FP568_04280 [Pandoraea pnomenusa]|uniref:hypothetical protein n=1 Tax=Pandoraea pnomenusa TaxID=93220 RepID=UPI00119842B8|nr:hypothetical protein [Pandoraea pnomenusa]QDX20546.1 hypothetical protein FP568_04280 [Pandoraea pnomenusa]
MAALTDGMKAHINVHLAKFRAVSPKGTVPRRPAHVHQVRPTAQVPQAASPRASHRAPGVSAKVRPLLSRILTLLKSIPRGRDALASIQARTERRHVDRAVGKLTFLLTQTPGADVKLQIEDTANRMIRHAARCASRIGSGMKAGDVLAARLKASICALSSEERVALGHVLTERMGSVADQATWPMIPMPNDTHKEGRTQRLDVHAYWLEALVSAQERELGPVIHKLELAARWKWLGTLAQWGAHLAPRSAGMVARLAKLTELANVAGPIVARELSSTALKTIFDGVNSVTELLRSGESPRSDVVKRAEDMLEDLQQQMWGDLRAPVAALAAAIRPNAPGLLTAPDSLDVIEKSGEVIGKFVSLNQVSIPQLLAGTPRIDAGAHAHACFELIRRMYPDHAGLRAATEVFDTLTQSSDIPAIDLAGFVRGLSPTVCYALGEKWGARPVVTTGNTVERLATTQTCDPAAFRELLGNIAQQAGDTALAPDPRSPGLHPIFVRDALGNTTMQVQGPKMVIRATNTQDASINDDAIRLSGDGLATCNEVLLDMCDNDAAWARRVSAVATQTGAQIFSAVPTPSPGGMNAILGQGDRETEYEIFRSSDHEMVVKIYNARTHCSSVSLITPDWYPVADLSTETDGTYRTEQCAFVVRRSGEISLLEPPRLSSDIRLAEGQLRRAIEKAHIMVWSPGSGGGNRAAFGTHTAVETSRSAGDPETITAQLQDDEIDVWASHAGELALRFGDAAKSIADLTQRAKSAREARIRDEFKAGVRRIAKHLTSIRQASTGRQILDVCYHLKVAVDRLVDRYGNLGRQAPTLTQLATLAGGEISTECAAQLRKIASAPDGLPMLRALIGHGSASSASPQAWRDDLQRAIDTFIHVLVPGNVGKEKLRSLSHVQQSLAGDARTALGMYFNIGIVDSSVVTLSRSLSATLAMAERMADFNERDERQWRENTRGVAETNWPVIPADVEVDVGRRTVWIGDAPKCPRHPDEMRRDLLELTGGNRRQTWMVARSTGQELTALIWELMYKAGETWPFEKSGEPCLPSGFRVEDQESTIHLRREPNGDVRVNMVERCQNARLLMINAADPMSNAVELEPADSWLVLSVSMLIDAEGRARLDDDVRLSCQWVEKGDEDANMVASPLKSPPLLKYAQTPYPPMSPLNLAQGDV